MLDRHVGKGGQVKKILGTLAAPHAASADLGLLALRLWFGAILLYTVGLQNWRHYDVFAERFVEAGLPRPAVIAAVALGSQLLGAGLLAAGLLTRLAALCVALTMSLEVYAFHRGFPPSVGQIIPMGYAVAAFGILLIGPGRASLDHLFFRRGG